MLGFGVGAASTTVPIFIGEIAPASYRGSLVTCMNLAITVGQFIACVVAGFYSTTREGWRYMFGVAIVPAVVQFVGFLYIPGIRRVCLSCLLVLFCTT